MNYSIKDESKIVSQKNNSEGGKNFILPNGTFLGDVFKFLPNGRINKTETGIGATTLELSSQRNSIVVQPLKITAIDKAKSPIHGNNIHYYGFVNNSGILIGTKKDKSANLKEYLLDNTNQYKKITLVVDNLQSLIADLGEDFKNYFLLLDEIDSIQKDSTFRSKMEDCIEIYKTFAIEKRALISATLLDFSDPILNDEILTIIKYDTSVKEPISIFQCENPAGYAVTLIKEKLNLIKVNNNQQKLVVAFNAVQKSIEIISLLKENKLPIIPDKQISILCGDQVKNKIVKAKFNNLGIQNGLLPSILNFTTSAYFTGFDISETYHLIIISDCNRSHTIVSELEMIQISGRCRLPSPRLLSFSIIHNWLKTETMKSTVKKEELIEAARAEIVTLKCIDNNYSKNPILKTKAKEMRNALVKNTGFNQFNFVKIDTSDNPSVSYLNIDAYIEFNRVKRELYNSKDSLYNWFKNEKYPLHRLLISSKIKVSQGESDTKKINYQELERLKTKLETLKTSELDKLESFRSTLKGSITPKMCDFVLDAIKKISIQDIRVHLGKINTMNDLKVLDEAFKVFVLTDDPMKTLIHATFKIGESFTYQDLDRKLENILVESGKIKANEFENRSARKFLRRYVLLTETTVKGNDSNAFKISNHNPRGFKKIR